MTQDCHYKQDGGKEGIARSISQLCTYPFETRKTKIQVGLRNPRIINCYRGAVQSSFTSGFVFASYFTIYNSLHPNPLASSIASFITSFIKIPIANCMRVLQINEHHRHFIESGSIIVKKRGLRGLYSGYGISVIEDIIETNIRDYLYEKSKNIVQMPIPAIRMVTGSFAGAIGASITTPFDTIRANLAHNTLKVGRNDIFGTTKALILSQEGPKALFRGVHLRAASNAIRYALFYLVMEYLYLIR